MAIDNKKMEEISKRFLDLPEDIQKALFSADTSDAIFEVGKKHGLAVDKMGELADETGLVMLGMTKPSEYIKNLSQRLAVEPEKAKAVAEDINQKVFAPIRESLKKIHGIIPTTESPDSTRGKPTKPETVPIPKRELPPITPKPQIPPIEKRVEQILKEHETAKQEKKEPKIPLKIIMPASPGKTSDVLTSSTSDVKEGDVFPAESEKIPPASPILSGRIVEKTKPTVPDVFVKKIPLDSSESKPAQEQKDPYKEPI